MYAEVIPTLRLPRTIGPLTYRIPDELLKSAPPPQPGSWVVVPFRRQRCDGIVWKITKRTLAGKTIRAVLLLPAAPALTAEQLQLMLWLQQTYAISFSLALLTMLPSRPKRPRQRASVQASAQKRASAPLTIAPNRANVIGAAVHRALQHGGTAFLQLGALADRVVALRAAVRQVKGNQLLIVAPTHIAAERLAGHIRPGVQRHVIVLHGELPPAVLWERWQAVAAHRDALIISTRRGLFAPFGRLGAVIVDTETDPNHRQRDHNPRYDGRTVASELSRLHRCPLLALDAVPTLRLSLQRELRIPALPGRGQRRIAVDMKAERQHRRWEPLAAATEEFVRATNGLALLFLNRRGIVRSLHCFECRWVFACLACALPLVHFAVGEWRCGRCCREAPEPTACPRCRSVRLQMRGMGTQSLETWARHRFPDRPVIRIDREQANALLPALAVVVATEQILHLSDLPQFACVVMVHAESTLHLPDFSALERGVQLLERVAALGAATARVVFQTYNPAQPAIRALAEGAWRQFYREELRMRAKLALPPAARVLMLLGRFATDREATARAAALRATLSGATHLLPAGSSIEGPMLPAVPEQERHRRTFLVRLSGATRPATLHRVLSAIPPPWLVDAEPDTLLG